MDAGNGQAALQRLLDLEAIRDLARRYAHHVWRGEGPQAVGLFTEDGEMDTGDRPVIRGMPELLEAYEDMVGEARFQPFVHNHVIELDGDRATGTCYLDVRATVDGERMTGFGVYEDTYRRVGGQWRFSSRTLRMSRYEREAAPPGSSGGSEAG